MKKMTSIRLIYVLTAILTVHLTTYNTYADQTASTLTKKQPNRFLGHLVKKYGSHGTISFEGFEHLMHNLGIGDLALKHTLDSHREPGYKAPEVTFDDESTTYENEATDATTTTTTIATANAAEHDYNLIKLINTLDNDKQFDIFRTMHDSNHRHPRHREHAASKKTCLSPISLIQMYSPDQFHNTKNNPIYRSSAAPENDDHTHSDEETENAEFSVSNIQISPAALMNMCPALLVQIEQGSCSEIPTPTPAPSPASFKETPSPRHDDHDHHHENEHESTTNSLTLKDWIIAMVANLVISLFGVFGILLVPLSKFRIYHDFLRFMVAIAIGTLVGDALMHLIPHALLPDDHSHSHSHGEESISIDGWARHGDAEHAAKEARAVWLLAVGFLTAMIMYFIESMLPLISGGHGGHGHSHGLPPPPPVSNKVQTNPGHNINGSNNFGSLEDLDNDVDNSTRNNEENVMVKDTKVKASAPLTPVAFMVVIGDCLHNITDGMAIGGAFGVNKVTGLSVALAILLHELPHELGDFAFLLQSGVSMRRAFLFNFISSVLSFIGVIVGLLVVNANTEFVYWIYTGTAGTFLYIAFADLLPELSKGEQSIKMVLIQTAGIACGGIIMILIGLYEHDLEVVFEGWNLD